MFFVHIVISINEILVSTYIFYTFTGILVDILNIGKKLRLFRLEDEIVFHRHSFGPLLLVHPVYTIIDSHCI